MKYLKYVFVSMIAIFCIPNIVKAEKTKKYTNYKLGDEITVNVNTMGSEQGKFYVISDDSTTQTVTALYSTTIGEPVAYGRYSEINPIGGLPNTDSYATSVVKKELEEKYVVEAGWTTYKQVRLFSRDDMQKLQEEAGTTSSPTTLLKYTWLMSKNHYWIDYPLQNNTSSSNIPIAAVIGETNMIAHLEMTNTAYIRPVIVVSKDYIVGGFTEIDIGEPPIADDKPINSNICKEDSVLICEVSQNSSEFNIDIKTIANLRYRDHRNIDYTVTSMFDYSKAPSELWNTVLENQKKEPDANVLAARFDTVDYEKKIGTFIIKKEDSDVNITVSDDVFHDINQMKNYFENEGATCKIVCEDAKGSTSNGSQTGDTSNNSQTGTNTPMQSGNTNNATQNVKVENPKTGVYVSFGILISGIVAGLAYMATKKKKYFRKI